MALPSTTFTEMVTTTLRYVDNELTDNVSNNNALLRKLKQRGNIKTVAGGYEAQYPISYAENSTYSRISGYDTFNINSSNVLTSDKYDWATVVITVTASGDEIRRNSGKEQMINLVKARKQNAMDTAANGFSVDLYSDGSLQNQIVGLAGIIQTNGQGTVGGINSTTQTWWRNKFREIPGSGTYTKDTIQGEMNALWMDIYRGNDRTDLIVSSHDFYSVFEAGLDQYARYTNADLKSGTVNAGALSLAWKGAEVIFDSNTNFATTAEKMYFLDTKDIFLVQHRDAKWSAMDERSPINQDAVVIPIMWQGFMAVRRRAGQGVLIDAA